MGTIQNKCEFAGSVTRKSALLLFSFAFSMFLHGNIAYGQSDSVSDTEIERHRAQCMSLDMDGCRALAAANQRRYNRPAVSVESLRAACYEESDDACIGFTTRYSELESEDRDYSELVSLLLLNCENGHIESCRKAANHFSMGLGVAQDRERALEMVEYSCENDNLSACVSIASGQLQSASNSEERGHALGALATGCEMGSTYACTALAFQYRSDWLNVEQDLALAQQYESQLCALGGDGDCFRFASRYLRGEEAARGVELLALSCAADSGPSCAA